MKNTKKSQKKYRLNQKGGFFNIGGTQTKSQRDLIVKCDLTDVNSINNPFLMKDKINKCCPSSTFSFFTKNKSVKCDEMKKKYHEILSKDKRDFLKRDINISKINNPEVLQRMMIREERNFLGRPSRYNRLLNFGKKMMNIFNEPIQKKSDNEDYNSEFKSSPNKDSLPMTQAEIKPVSEVAKTVPAQSAPTQPTPTQSTPTQSAPTQSAPTQPTPTQSTPTQSAPTKVTEEIKTGCKRIKHKSRKNNKRKNSKNNKTRRR
jgi:hypothetical protein